jgi:hypothetical protein
MVEPISTKPRILERFRPTPRKGLRSPANLIKALRWSLQNDRPVVYMLALGWGYLLTSIILGYVLFSVPPRPDVGPVLDKTAKAVAALYPCMQFLTTWLQAKRAWRRRRGRNATSRDARKAR